MGTNASRAPDACTYCRNPLRRGTPQRSPKLRGIQFTRDHIMPRPWRAPMPHGVRMTRPACLACNQLRALLGHCPAMLSIASALRKRHGFRNRSEAAHALLLPLPTDIPT